MQYELSKAIEILSRTPEALRMLLSGLSPEWTEANEGADTWSAFDVAGHLLHGERTDWMARVEIILSGKEERKFRPFDRFAQFEESKGKTLDELLAAFQAARKANLRRLRSLNLTAADLQKTGEHPAFGTVTLSQLLSTWVVHDLDHLYQVGRVMAKQYREEVGPWMEYLKILRQ